MVVAAAGTGFSPTMDWDFCPFIFWFIYLYVHGITQKVVDGSGPLFSGWIDEPVKFWQSTCRERAPTEDHVFIQPHFELARSHLAW